MMTKFEGRASQMRESQWLAAEDLEGLGEVEVTIKQVNLHQNVQVEGQPKRDRVYTLEFDGRHKEMWINATNRKVLKMMYGDDVNAWSGKTITFYAQDGIRVGKTTKAGIRVKFVKQEG